MQKRRLCSNKHNRRFSLAGEKKLKNMDKQAFIPTHISQCGSQLLAMLFCQQTEECKVLIWR